MEASLPIVHPLPQPCLSPLLPVACLCSLREGRLAAVYMLRAVISFRYLRCFVLVSTSVTASQQPSSLTLATDCHPHTSRLSIFPACEPRSSSLFEGARTARQGGPHQLPPPWALRKEPLPSRPAALPVSSFSCSFCQFISTVL